MTSPVEAARARRVLALALIAVAIACGRDADPPAPPAAKTPPQSDMAKDDRPALIFLGDSLTAGFGLSAEQSVPALIQAEIDKAGLDLRVINAGRSADTTAGGVARIDYYLRKEVKPRGIIVWLGANDAMRGLRPVEIEANLRTIAQRVHAFDIRVPVFLVQMRAFPNLGADYAKTFESIYPRIGESENVTLLPFPLEEVAGRPELNQPDGIHPTAEGTRRVAAALWTSLRPHLGGH
jgi:acyl-CoA thioesterase I